MNVVSLRSHVGPNKLLENLSRNMMTGIFLSSVPGAYFNGILICFFVDLIRQHGFILSPWKVAKLTWPILKSLLLGFVPAVLISQFIQYFTSPALSISLILGALGVFVSAVLLHRVLLTKVNKATNWNIAIVVLALIQLALLGFLHSSISGLETA